jgi:catechol 2,3-dioxygenase-like lactoylglutathione lyase family enzyme
VIASEVSTGDGKRVIDMSSDRNAPPRSGWARFVVELHVADLTASLAFWKDIIGFEVAFERAAERFVYLEHPEGQQIMLCQRHGRFETGPMQPPLGQGAMFQIYLSDISGILAKLSARIWPIYLGPRRIWRKTGDRESGQEEFFVQDPDGYLLMLAHSIGERPPGAGADYRDG